jgi:hypothetical protein
MEQKVVGGVLTDNEVLRGVVRFVAVNVVDLRRTRQRSP